MPSLGSPYSGYFYKPASQFLYVINKRCFIFGKEQHHIQFDIDQTLDFLHRHIHFHELSGWNQIMLINITSA
ncbi:hypothetical protein ABEZ21_23760 [Brevibacillus porteri]|uniref:hypothetical protein n=1 Tax=Brevibacillus porteri TaxID=2126350 RepID=UPI0011B20A9C|nr:hypothetical protein [Brevibacillus porteri]MED2745143.1 hypothetical protein [Brevibacillus porteri]MED2813437.1 hypothetical protein [Brevibacillus porteri]MED4898690.1 hypothetical protein [Brevibacillus porteri]